MLRLWDVAGEVLLLETDAGAGPLTGIAFSSDGAMLAVAGTKAVRVFLAPEHR